VVGGGLLVVGCGFLGGCVVVCGVCVWGGWGGGGGGGGGEEDGWRAITARKKCRVYSLE